MHSKKFLLVFVCTLIVSSVALGKDPECVKDSEGNMQCSEMVVSQWECVNQKLPDGSHVLVCDPKAKKRTPKKVIKEEKINDTYDLELPEGGLF